MDYRSDLTGLRALAVAAVVFFHFGVPGFNGGFAGVDVFFVISGYLMTRIIVGGIASGRFSLAMFYLSRVKRIIPALVFLCLVLLIVGFLYLGKRDFYSLSKHVVASVLFLSNFIYKNEAGYFDADSHEKWLLHTWSLSVEWQFYLLYPILILALAKHWSPSTRAFRTMLWGLSTLSFLASVITTNLNPTAAFFLLPTRAWELLAGGLVYVYSDRQRGAHSVRLLEIAGLVLIGVSILALSGSTSWPGYWAAIPVVGTSLILLAAPTSLWSSNPASQAIGKWSYSIYLWHWPVFVASHYFDWKQTVVSQISLILVSVGLGYLSYRFIEEPCRHSAFAKTLNWRKAGVMALPVVMLGIVGIATKGLPARLPSAVAAIEADPAHLRGNPAVLCEQTQRMHGLNACLMGNASVPPAVAVLGDSHAGALLYAVKRAATDSDIRVLALLSAACPPIEDIQGIAGIPGEGCKRYVASSLAALDELDSIRSVVLIARWSVYVEGYSEKAGGPYALFDRNGMRETSARRQEYRHRLVNSLCHMAKRRTVYVVLPLPEHSKNIPREMARQLITDSDKDFPVVSIAEYDRRNAVVLESLKEASEICGIRLLDPRPYLRGETGYMGAVNGRPAYYDDDHLNEYGNTLIFGMLDRVEEFGTRRLR